MGSISREDDSVNILNRVVRGKKMEDVEVGGKEWLPATVDKSGGDLLGVDSAPLLSRRDAEAAGVGDEWNPLDHILWPNVGWFTLLHLASFYALTLITSSSIYTWAWALWLYGLSLFSMTAGVHRLWCHRSYKARLPLRIFLAVANGIAYQNSVFEWARDHRVHHKYTETNADPVNAARGFFFSHVGWLMCKKHPDVKKIGGKVDLSDVLGDPVIAWQRRYYVPLVIAMCFVMPTIVPWIYWGETLWNSYFIAMVLRYTVVLNVTWLVNSAGHIYGSRPYDKTIAPTDNFLTTFLSIGEGYHNFHHTFPWDYSASEWGYKVNLTKVVLDLCACVGLAYDFKQVTPEMIHSRKERTGERTGSEKVNEYSDHGYM